MTREEIKNTPELIDFLLDKSLIAASREKLRKRLEEICNLAIKALEREPVLDKIKAEIVHMPTISFNVNDIYKADVLAIIDKYKAESEKKE